jgi:hypothetical protein
MLEQNINSLSADSFSPLSSLKLTTISFSVKVRVISKGKINDYIKKHS